MASTPTRVEQMSFPRITTTADQMARVPCIRGLRIPVATVVGMVADGMSDAEIPRGRSGSSEDVREALLLCR